MKVITLCGSTKFKKHFEYVNAILTLQGHIVLSVGVFVHSDNLKISDDQKTGLDELHKRKIDLSDEVFVLDVDGYVGNSTQGEIEYARRRGKPVRFLSEIGVVSGIEFPDLFECK